jgi:hypothetical protein
LAAEAVVVVELEGAGKGKYGSMGVWEYGNVKGT